MLFAILFALGIHSQPAKAAQLLDLTDTYQVFLQTCSDPADEKKGLSKYRSPEDIYVNLFARKVEGLGENADAYVLSVGGWETMKPSAWLMISKSPSEQLGELVHASLYTAKPESTDKNDLIVSTVVFKQREKRGYFSIGEFASADHPDILGGNYCAPGEVSTVYLNSGLANMREISGH